MSNSAAKSSRESETEETRPLLRYGSVFAQLAVTALVVWIGVSTLHTMSKLLGRSTGPSTKPAIAADPEAHQLAAALVPPAGHWTVQGLEWGLGRRELTTEEVEKRLEEVFADDSVSSAIESTKHASDLPDEWQSLLGQVKDLEPVRRGDNLVYNLNQPTLKAKFVVRDTKAGEQLVAGVIAFPMENDRWELIDLVPPTTLGETGSEDHLLPLPAHAQRQLARWSEDGQLVMELINVDADGRSLITVWEQAGWHVNHSNMGNFSEFSLFCHRRGNSIYVWSHDPFDSISSLMLVNTRSVTKKKSREDSHE